MSRYAGNIKVVGADLMCFPVHPKTLEPLGVSCYDAFAVSDPESGTVEMIGTGEWNLRRNALRSQERLKWIQAWARS